MGEGYRNLSLIVTMAVGAMIPVAQSGTLDVLMGMNAHGKIAIYRLIVSALVLVLMLPVVGVIGWTPTSAGLLIGTSWTAGYLLVVPFFLRARYEVAMLPYLLRSLVIPAALNAPLLGCMWLARSWLLDEQWLYAFIMLAVGGITTLALYWILILPPQARQMVRSRMSFA